MVAIVMVVMVVIIVIMVVMVVMGRTDRKDKTDILTWLSRWLVYSTFAMFFLPGAEGEDFENRGEVHQRTVNLHWHCSEGEFSYRPHGFFFTPLSPRWVWQVLALATMEPSEDDLLLLLFFESMISPCRSPRPWVRTPWPRGQRARRLFAGGIFKVSIFCSLIDLIVWGSYLCTFKLVSLWSDSCQIKCLSIVQSCLVSLTYGLVVHQH